MCVQAQKEEEDNIVFKMLPCLLFLLIVSINRQPRHTLLVYSRIHSCVLSMPSVSQSCLRICSSLAVSVGNVPRRVV